MVTISRSAEVFSKLFFTVRASCCTDDISPETLSDSVWFASLTYWKVFWLSFLSFNSLASSWDIRWFRISLSWLKFCSWWDWLRANSSLIYLKLSAIVSSWFCFMKSTRPLILPRFVSSTLKRVSKSDFKKSTSSRSVLFALLKLFRFSRAFLVRARSS